MWRLNIRVVVAWRDYNSWRLTRRGGDQRCCRSVAVVDTGALNGGASSTLGISLGFLVTRKIYGDVRYTLENVNMT